MIVTTPDSSQHCYPQLPESTTPIDPPREPALNIGVYKQPFVHPQHFPPFALSISILKRSISIRTLRILYSWCP